MQLEKSETKLCIMKDVPWYGHCRHLRNCNSANLRPKISFQLKSQI